MNIRSVRNVLGVFSLLLLGSLVGGCSSVQVHPVSVAQVNDPSISGVRFFQSAPYLLITEMPTPPHPMPPMKHGPRFGGPMGHQGHPGPMAMREGERHEHGHHADADRHDADHHGDHHGPLVANHVLETPHRMPGKHGMQGMHGMHRGMHMRPKHHGKGPMHHMMMARMMGGQKVFCLQIIYLPDYSHPYVADIHGGMGHSPNSIQLSNGWELLGLNTKGHLSEPQPIRAMTAMPPMPPMPMHMMRHNNKHSNMHHMTGMHKKDMWGGHKGKMRRMMMSRHAAMAMGLRPGLYRFVFNAKTGQLQGLKRVKMMGHHHCGPHGWMWHKHMKDYPAAAPVK